MPKVALQNRLTRQDILNRVRVGQDLILSLGKHNLKEEVGVTPRQAGRCRAMARAWDKQCPGLPLEPKHVPGSWLTMTLVEIEMLGAANPGTGPNGGTPVEVEPRPVWNTFGSILRLLVDDAGGECVRVHKVGSSYFATLPDGTVVQVGEE